MSRFDDALVHLLLREGGYSFHPDDRGGPTNLGITLVELRRWRKNQKLTAKDVKALTKVEAAAIYKAHYWNALKLDHVADPMLSTLLFDQAVNRGVGAAGRQIQSILNTKFGYKLAVDGVIGPKTLLALNSVRADEFLIEYVSACQHAYASIVARDPSQATFLRGWLNRTHHLFKLLLNRSA